MSAPHDILRRFTKSSQHDLTLVTCVLGASASWLIQSLAAESLKAGASVVLASFVHDHRFHENSIQKLGVDLAQCQCESRFVFADAGAAALNLETSASTSAKKTSELENVTSCIKKAVAALPSSAHGTVLLLESADFLLASTTITSYELWTALQDWSHLVSYSAVSINADAAFLTNPKTRLEVEHKNFATTLGHQASCVMGLRMLDTGVAKDVSGVLRTTGGGRYERSDRKLEGRDRESEMLYYVEDGGVKIFYRGQSRT